MISFFKRYHRAIFSAVLLCSLVAVGGMPAPVSAAKSAKEYCADKYPSRGTGSTTDPSGQQRAACRAGYATRDDEDGSDALKACSAFPEGADLRSICVKASGESSGVLGQSQATKFCKNQYKSNDPASQQNRAACISGFVAKANGNKPEEACAKYKDSQNAACLKGGVSETAAKINKPEKAGSVSIDTGAYGTGLPKASAGRSQIQSVLQIVFGVIAALAVLMIVLSGLRFITAQGNPQEVAKARGTIAYAVAGLLVAIGAQAIVTLVASKL